MDDKTSTLSVKNSSFLLKIEYTFMKFKKNLEEFD